MDSDDPDLEAFKSNLCWILGERDLGKAAPLVSNLCPNTSDPQSISVSSNDNARRESTCGTSSQVDLEDLLDDHKISSEWKFEGHIYFEAGCWPAGKTYEDAVRALMKTQFGQNLWRRSSGSIVEFFGSARLVFKGGLPDSENSKLVKALTVPKVTSRNPRHAAGAHWHW